MKLIELNNNKGWAAALLSAGLLGPVTGCVEHRVTYVPTYPAQPAYVAQPPPQPQVVYQSPPVAVPAPPPATVVVQAPPPPPRVEVVPLAPGPAYVWAPGYWSWHGRWVWANGSWVVRPRPTAMWVNGYWVHRGGGYVYVRGHWR